MKKLYCPYCGGPAGECNCEQIAAEEYAAWLEEYESRPETIDGWHQQDMIDLRRREQ